MEEIEKYKQSQITSKLRPFIKINNGSGGTEDVHYSLLYEDLPEEFKACARAELNETEEKKTKGMKRFKEIMKRENIAAVDDRTVMFFLRSCKYDLSKAEAKFLKFHKSYRKLIRTVIEMDLELIEQILNEDVFGFLPYRDKHGRAIIYSRHSSNPVISNNINDVFVLATALAFLIFKYSPISSVAGISSIACHKDVPLIEYYNMMKVIKNHFSFWMHLPMRYRRADIINEHPFTRFFYKLIRPFMTLKSSERICFHGSDLGGLLEYYHPDLLPEEFGGNLGPISQISFKEEMLNMVKILKENPEAYK